jgi:hypothetical protein
MNRILLGISFTMAWVMSFFSPLTISHGDQGCCAECTLKKEDEIEIVDEYEGRHED